MGKIIHKNFPVNYITELSDVNEFNRESVLKERNNNM